MDIPGLYAFKRREYLRKLAERRRLAREARIRAFRKGRI